jgi:hypothetical protein
MGIRAGRVAERKHVGDADLSEVRLERVGPVELATLAAPISSIRRREAGS